MKTFLVHAASIAVGVVLGTMLTVAIRKTDAGKKVLGAA
jgi:hypothetical protein